MAWVSDRRTFIAAGMVSLVAALTGCGGGGSPGDGGNGGGGNTVTGTVFDSRKGDLPVEGATVTIAGVSATTTRTPEASSSRPVGSFVLRNVPADQNTITITFANTRPVGDNGGEEDFTDTQTLRFEPSTTSGTTNIGDLYVNIGQVTGQVLLPSGQPAPADAFLSITSIAGGDIRTDANGRFFAELIPLGQTEVTAFYRTASVTRVVTVNNGVNDLGTFQLVDDPNPNPPGLPATIVGKVALSDGQNAEGATVILLRDGTQLEQTVADANSSFSFYVPTGNYSVRVLRDGYNEGGASGQVTNPNGALDLQTITLSPRT